MGVLWKIFRTPFPKNTFEGLSLKTSCYSDTNFQCRIDKGMSIIKMKMQLMKVNRSYFNYRNALINFTDNLNEQIKIDEQIKLANQFAP